MISQQWKLKFGKEPVSLTAFTRVYDPNLIGSILKSE